MPNVTRRAAMIGAAVSSIALAAPVVAGAIDPDAAMVAAYRKWADAYDAASAEADEVLDDAMSVLTAAEAELLAMRPVTPRGVAIQFLAFTCWGEFAATESNLFDFEAHMRALAAVSAPVTHPEAARSPQPVPTLPIMGRAS